MAAVPSEIVVIDQPAHVSTKTVATEQVTEVLDLAPPLLPTEKIGPMGWVRLLLHFELPENYDADELTSIFKKSYTAFKDRVPIAGCESIPTPTYLEDGVLQLRHYGNEIEHDFKVKDLRNGDFPSFEELKRQGFPTAVLDPEIVCQRGQGGEWPAAGVDRLNTTMLQLNFINGGLLLNMLFLHTVVDGACMYKFTELLAEEVRKAQGLSIPEPAEVPMADREKITKSSGAKPGNPEDHPEYVEIPFTPTGPPEKLAAPITHGNVFYFSPEKCQALKELASPANAKLFKSNEDNAPFISTNDAITALVWRCTLNAQHKHKQGEDKPSGPAMLGLALDARRRYAGQDVHKHTIGNILGFAPAVMDIDTLMDEDSTTLADIALIVRGAVNKSKDSYLDSITARVERVGNVARLIPTIFLDMPGNHGLLSSWREFPFYDIKWGPALGDRMLALRPPRAGITHSMQVLLPQRPEAGPGIEVFVNTEHSAMETLLNDPLFREYAQAPERV
ncbi:trichothecene 3-o-acetyltransferase [Fusarium longipes]|uniref:Trichothecene 3-o-acetyltransferase n=1 Tax=Fusarium longipes TaxID=694270 RepID=A0A395S9N7_9HYPO|nr:trichothecene 3-o-acetyltransferase [Fusarium longipes]